jgi:antitoxin HicB
MRFGLNGKSYNIRKEDILVSTKGVPPKPFDGRNRYYIELHGEKYPIKQPIHLVTGLPYTGPFGAQDAGRILKKLGFNVRRLEDDRVREKVKKSDAYTVTSDGVMKFAVTLEQDEDGFIVVSCPALPGCHSQGRTEAEAISNIREAIKGYIASMRRHNEPVPNILEVREVEVAA